MVYRTNGFGTEITEELYANNDMTVYAYWIPYCDYSYTKTHSSGHWIATYKCENGIARMTSCSLDQYVIGACESLTPWLESGLVNINYVKYLG